jgi:hypothetical protein
LAKPSSLLKQKCAQIKVYFSQSTRGKSHVLDKQNPNAKHHPIGGTFPSLPTMLAYLQYVEDYDVDET